MAEKNENPAKSFFYETIAAILIAEFLFLSYYPKPIAYAATLNAGSNFTVCTGVAVQPFYTTQTNPSVTLYWEFSSYLNTQATYRIQIDNDAAFGSPLDTGVVSSVGARSYGTSTTGLSFGTRYYWRIVITDNLSSETDWINGDSFITNKPSIKLRGGIKLKGGVRLK